MGQPDGVTSVAKEQAGEVGRTAADAGGNVAHTTKEQAGNVVGEAKQQARDLVGEARTQARTQAGAQKGRAVETLRTLGGELDEMAQQGGQSGIATEVARQVAQRTHALADHLDRHEPADLLEQVRSYARRRPVAFLAGAAVAGILAGRLTRNLASSDDDAPRGLTGGTTPALPAVEPVTDFTPAYSEGAPGYGYGQQAPVDTGYAGTGYESTPGTGYAAPAYPADQPGGTYQGDPAYQGGAYQGEPAYQDPGYQGGSYQGDPAYQDDPQYRPVPGGEPPARGWTS